MAVTRKRNDESKTQTDDNKAMLSALKICLKSIYPQSYVQNEPEKVEKNCLKNCVW